jgi:hypothetical protein
MVVVYRLSQRDAKEIRRKGEETKQETERHTHGTEPTSQPRPTQNTMEAAKATQEHEPTGTKKRNNHTRHKPENARPQRPPAQTPNRNRQQRHKTAYQGQKRGRHAQAGRGGAGQTPTPEPAKPRQQGGTRPTNAEGEMARGHRKGRCARRRPTDGEQQQDGKLGQPRPQQSTQAGRRRSRRQVQRGGRPREEGARGIMYMSRGIMYMLH